ncbi:TPA: hypothetical protein U1151_001143 [Streptococcus suis]|nr:hypothetical protein [Streptococcus suis]HEM4953002.1 hypothetical protein [Streptococcus suis]
MNKVKLASGQEISQDFYDKLTSVTNKRARFVIDQIMKYGECSTEDLKKAGYEHAPRAKRDVVELGIPIQTNQGTDSSGRRMAVYVFGNWEEYKKQNNLAKTRGRNNLSDKLKESLIKEHGTRDMLYGEEFPESLLQVDHRIPFEIGGDPENMLDTSHFMLLSPSANRAKSWACEHCSNWSIKDIELCKTCYFANPENYSHVSGTKEKRLDIIFKDSDVEIYNKIMSISKEKSISIQDAFLDLIKESINADQ